MSDQYPRIYVSRTAREWELLEKKIKELGKKSVSDYIAARIPDLKSLFDECPHCICIAPGRKVQKFQYVRVDRYQLLSELSDKTGISENVLVNRLIIEPLLIIP